MNAALELFLTAVAGLPGAPFRAGKTGRAQARGPLRLVFRNKTPMFHRRDMACFVVAVLHRTIAIRKQ